MGRIWMCIYEIYMKRIWKECVYIYICITESLCYTVEINTLQIKYTLKKLQWA